METDEPLETGYDPTTPGRDTLMLDFVRGESASYSALVSAQGGRVAHDGELGLAMTDTGSPSPFGNIALFERPLSEREVAEAMRRLHAFYAAASGGPFGIFSTWPTPDLRDHGCGLIGHPPWMLREPAPLRPPPAGLRIERISSRAAFPDWERVMVEGYPVPEVAPYRPGCLMDAGAVEASGWHFFVGYVDGEPVATSAAWVDDAHVRVDFVSLLEAHRGRGYGEALTGAATAAAGDDRPATLVSSDLGRPVYERMGYRSLVRITLWAGHRGAAA
jgi:GNAT superfamily N-acetyltransferase